MTTLGMLLVLLFVSTTSLHQQAQAWLHAGFYDQSCPSVDAVVTSVLKQAMQSDVRIAASLIRMHFHDCFVLGCDASVLLDDTPTFTGEKTAPPNSQSLRGFDVVDQIKAQVESVCPNTVSCADILAIASKAGVVLNGGPSWTVLLGRRDSTTASFSLANTSIPSPASTDAQLIASFAKQGLTAQDMVTLSGAHTFGRARCATFSSRLYNNSGSGQPDSRINSAYLSQLQGICPNGGDANAVSSLDPFTKDVFDNQYFRNVQNGYGLLNSDAELLNGTATIGFVNIFASDTLTFFNNFAASMVSMGNINPLTGSQGEIRTNCRKTN